MARRQLRDDDEAPKPRRRRPATSPEARESQMVSLAFDEAERQIREGSASSQLLTHFVKLGSERERKEQMKIQLETQLLEKRISTLETAERLESLMDEALDVFRGYSGQRRRREDEEDER